MSNLLALKEHNISSLIYLIRGEKVMLEGLGSKLGKSMKELLSIIITL
jgi:hypothetical protein